MIQLPVSLSIPVRRALRRIAFGSRARGRLCDRLAAESRMLVQMGVRHDLLPFSQLNPRLQTTSEHMARRISGAIGDSFRFK
jgi:hypothetical protein